MKDHPSFKQKFDYIDELEQIMEKWTDDEEILWLN
jgi:hypothetical protein